VAKQYTDHACEDERETEISQQHYDGQERMPYDEYMKGVPVDAYGRLPIGFEVVVTPYYQLISCIPAGTKGRVTLHFTCVTMPQFQVKWKDHQSNLPGHGKEDRTWFSAADIYRYDLLGKFTHLSQT
jgi:hypothetical protein